MSRGMITAELRRETGKGAARRLRRSGKIPGVLYGKKKDTVGLQIDQLALQRLVSQWGSGRLIDLEVDGSKEVVLLRDLQRDPVRGTIEHVDFYAIALDEETTAVVPVFLTGEDARPSDGGVVTPALREMEVSCLPTDIPERLDIDVSNLTVGDTLTVGDVELPDGVKPILDEDEVVVSVTIPTEIEEIEDVEDADDVEAAEEDAEADEAEDAPDSED